MNKISRPTYLGSYKSSLVVAAADIEGVHGLILECNYLLVQLQYFIKSVKFCCGDNYILNNVTPQLFPPSCQVCQ